MSCITKLLKTIKQSITQNKLLKIIICLIGFIVIFILMLMISSFAINWLVNTPNPFGLGFIDESNKDTWINFFGAIIGGITTLAGVWLTIREERKNSLEQQKRLELQRREDLAMQYRPIFHCNVTDIAITNNNCMLIVKLKIKNTGRAEASAVKIKSSSKLPLVTMVSYDSTPMIEANKDLNFIVTFVYRGENLGDDKYQCLPLIDNQDKLNTSIDITFSDIVNTKYCLCFDLECRYTVNLNLKILNNKTLDQLGDFVKNEPQKWSVSLKNTTTKKI